jgi:hypothetical protein
MKSATSFESGASFITNDFKDFTKVVCENLWRHGHCILILEPGDCTRYKVLITCDYEMTIVTDLNNRIAYTLGQPRYCCLQDLIEQHPEANKHTQHMMTSLILTIFGNIVEAKKYFDWKNASLVELTTIETADNKDILDWVDTDGRITPVPFTHNRPSSEFTKFLGAGWEAITLDDGSALVHNTKNFGGDKINKVVNIAAGIEIHGPVIKVPAELWKAWSF